MTFSRPDMRRLSDEDLLAARVVVVDDEAVVTQSISLFFRIESMPAPIVFNDPRDAVAYLQDHEVDVIISDILMPDMDGIELLAAARAAQPDVPRVLLTGYADKDRTIQAINEVGVFQFVEKPWDNELLKQVVLNALERRLLVRRLAEEQAKLIQAEKLSSVGFFAAGVAHEINNPLAGVMGCIKALRRGSVPQERQQEYFDTAEDALRRIQVIVRDLLDYARQRDPAPAPLDPAQLVEVCLRLVSGQARSKGVEIESQLNPAGSEIVADRAQMMQAVINLLANALHAVLPGSGRIVISSTVRENRYSLHIQDNGPGIPVALRARVLEPFFTTKREGEGTGLGLAVTSGIVRAHRGDLEIGDADGGGTRVTISLPVVEGSDE